MLSLCASPSVVLGIEAGLPLYDTRELERVLFNPHAVILFKAF